MAYIYNGLFLSLRKEQNFAIGSNVEGIMLSEMSQMRQILYDITCVCVCVCVCMCVCVSRSVIFNSL